MATEEEGHLRVHHQMVIGDLQLNANDVIGFDFVEQEEEDEMEVEDSPTPLVNK